MGGHGPGMQDPLLFSLAVLAILGTPGPTNTLLATSGALSGVRRSLPLVLAEVTGYLLAIGVLALLLGEILQAYAGLATMLRLLIAGYLVHAAWGLWQRSGSFADGGRAIGFDRVFVTTLLNPKAVVFAFGVIPLSDPAAAAYVAAFAGFVVLAALAWIAIGASAARRAGGRHGRLVPRLSAVALTLFAGLIAVG